ncbi:hypothetical protein [Loktanella sp. 3ANDIMAR09]|uniref:hypothetical protein n=1 Tax=Loktanella sp. 3ANDIMAR09 TaxID=1225657 RepID=UPI0006FB2233|nr:hypothetical protein [Loktanella sp. 3ANDIMAR09]
MLLILRTFVMYPAAGVIAAAVGFIEYDAASRILTVDVDAAGAAIAGLVWVGGSGATFALSRVIKARGGAV